MSQLDCGAIQRHLQDLEEFLAVLEHPCRLQERHHQVLGLGALPPKRLDIGGHILAAIGAPQSSLREHGVIPEVVADAVVPMAETIWEMSGHSPITLGSS